MARPKTKLRELEKGRGHMRTLQGRENHSVAMVQGMGDPEWGRRRKQPAIMQGIARRWKREKGETLRYDIDVSGETL